jgi:RHS repeat-associated protein
LIWYEGATQTSTLRRYLHADPRGSIVAVTDHTGNRIATNTYDEYGIPDTATGNDIATKGRFRYTGQAWIPELGMYYYKARIYSPTLGRFLQTDPIGYEDQFNLYGYVGNDPINAVDPTGENAVKLFVKRTIKHRGNIIEAAIDVGGEVVTVFHPASTPLERLTAVAELVSPVAPSDIRSAEAVVRAATTVTGGRRGGVATRSQNRAIGDRIQSQGGQVTGGLDRGPETRFAGPTGQRRGTRYSDGSATDRDGNGFQVQTVDTRSGGRLTTRESDAARDIAERSGQPVACVPKKRACE